MPSINEVRLMGHLGKDAETQYTPSGACVTKFTLATTHSFRRQGETEWTQATTWHNIIAWRLHEKLQPLLVKGALVYASGRIETRSYDDRDGQKRWITEVIADKVQFLRMPTAPAQDRRPQEQPAPAQDRRPQEQPVQSRPAHARQQAAEPAQAPASYQPEPWDDDMVPF
jgi:single-strand DNA-binding protein